MSVKSTFQRLPPVRPPLSLIHSIRKLPSSLPTFPCVPFSSYRRRDIVCDDILSQHGRISYLLLQHMRPLGEVGQEVANALHTSQLRRRYLVTRYSIKGQVKGSQLQLERD